MFDSLYRALNSQLEKMLTENVKLGKVVLVRAQKEGPLWPRPTNCKPVGAGGPPPGANYTAVRAHPSSNRLSR